jgi:hypothetical protein
MEEGPSGERKGVTDSALGVGGYGVWGRCERLDSVTIAVLAGRGRG